MVSFNRFYYGALAATLGFFAGESEAANPLGLTPFGPVVQNTIDMTPVDGRAANYEAFRGTIVSYFEDPLNQSPNGGNTFFDPDQPGPMVISGDSITIPFQALARMYFVRESNSFGDSLGFLTNSNGNADLIGSGNSLLFPLADSPDSGVPANQNLDIASPGFFMPDPTPDMGILQQGLDHPDDFVDMGTLAGGTKLDVFLIPDGADRMPGSLVETEDDWNNRATNELDTVVWWLEDDFNVDKQDRHAQVVKFQDGMDLYYLIAFEDVPLPTADGLRGSTDYRDVVTVLQITVVPEPGSYALMATFLVLGLWTKRRVLA